MTRRWTDTEVALVTAALFILPLGIMFGWWS